jgi:hypothetical protein
MMHTDLQQLSTAAAGLLYMSETDAPFEAFEIPASSHTIAENIRLMMASAPVEIQDVNYFFRNQVRLDEGASDADRERSEQFKRLLLKIRQLLPDAQVYRSGTTRIEAFIAGTFADGSRGGLRTIVVET